MTNLIDPNSIQTLQTVANEVCRLLTQFGLIETEVSPDGYELMDDDHYAIYEEFTTSILDGLQKQNDNPQ